MYIKFYFLCVLLHLQNSFSALITSGKNRDAVYFEFTKSFDSLPSIPVEKLGRYRLDGWMYNSDIKEKSFHNESG